ncbi:MAG: exopolysaccharide biosynthesis protein [Pseudomonadota bacterium]
MTAASSHDAAISQQLAKLAADAPIPHASLAWVMGQLNERAFGLFLLVLALPCCIPFLYGIPQIVALPLMFVSAQMLIGRTSPWLPARLGARNVSKEGLESLSRRSGPWLRRIEAVSRPRLQALSYAPADRVVALGLVLFSASILLPIPATNTVPGFAVVIIAMGLLQRDGILILLGLVLGIAWIAALILAGATLVSLMMGWLGL